MGKEEQKVKAKRHTPNQVIRKLREAERMLGEGMQVAEVAIALLRLPGPGWELLKPRSRRVAALAPRQWAAGLRVSSCGSSSATIRRLSSRRPTRLA